MRPGRDAAPHVVAEPEPLERIRAGSRAPARRPRRAAPAALAPGRVARVEPGGALADRHLRHDSGLVPAGRIDAQHVGAEPGEQAGRHRSGQHAGEVEHPQTRRADASGDGAQRGRGGIRRPSSLDARPAARRHRGALRMRGPLGRACAAPRRSRPRRPPRCLELVGRPAARPPSATRSRSRRRRRARAGRRPDGAARWCAGGSSRPPSAGRVVAGDRIPRRRQRPADRGQRETEPGVGESAVDRRRRCRRSPSAAHSSAAARAAVATDAVARSDTGYAESSVGLARSTERAPPGSRPERGRHPLAQLGLGIGVGIGHPPRYAGAATAGPGRAGRRQRRSSTATTDQRRPRRREGDEQRTRRARRSGSPRGSPRRRRRRAARRGARSRSRRAPRRPRPRPPEPVEQQHRDDGDDGDDQRRRRPVSPCAPRPARAPRGSSPSRAIARPVRLSPASTPVSDPMQATATARSHDGCPCRGPATSATGELLAASPSVPSPTSSTSERHRRQHEHRSRSPAPPRAAGCAPGPAPPRRASRCARSRRRRRRSARWPAAPRAASRQRSATTSARQLGARQRRAPRAPRPARTITTAGGDRADHRRRCARRSR